VPETLAGAQLKTNEENKAFVLSFPLFLPWIYPHLGELKL